MMNVNSNGDHKAEPPQKEGKLKSARSSLAPEAGGFLGQSPKRGQGAEPLAELEAEPRSARQRRPALHNLRAEKQSRFSALSFVGVIYAAPAK